MRYYAVFLRYSNGRLLESVGDQHIIRLDGRLSLANMRAIAVEECKKRGFDAYTIERGNSLLSTFAVTLPTSVFN